MKNKLRAGLFALLLSTGLSPIAHADSSNGLPGCGIYSENPIESNFQVLEQQKLNNPITIQCGTAGNAWNGIKSTARLTNDTGKVLNYRKSGGNL
ncbi:hypothetical protein [Bhargavaea cecembensis]|uniref:hypothetical protein n=1 Tax=Bhargavaea cecembensis TaxID=394098 RepID=UPI0011773C70|nr:hypothetical protein [Bhargavaea cecembensis]